MEIKTSAEIDFLIEQHKTVKMCLKRYNDYVNRNTKETKDHHVIFANNVTLRNNYRALERTLRIQLECYGIRYDGKGVYLVGVKCKNDNKDEQKKDTADNN